MSLTMREEQPARCGCVVVRLAEPADGARGVAGFFARLWPFVFFAGASDSPPARNVCQR